MRTCFLLATCLETLWKLVELSFHSYIRPKVSCMEGKMAKMTAAFFQPLVKNFQKSTFSTFSFSGVYSEHRNSVEKFLRACFLLATCLKISPKLYETRWDIRYIRLVDMKCPLVVVILIYTHLMQVCWIVTLWEVSRLITQPLIISIVTETCTSFDCIAIRIDHVSQPNIYSLASYLLRKLHFQVYIEEFH